jgi:hypothetical protein
MSIYRRPGWMDRNDIHQIPARGRVPAPESRPSSGASATSQDWSTHRRVRPAEHLLPFSEKWMDLLPPDVFPGALATHYPRIVNLIAMQWNDRSACPAYFDELLEDRRGGRQGFPAVRLDLPEAARLLVRRESTPK